VNYIEFENFPWIMEDDPTEGPENLSKSKR